MTVLAFRNARRLELQRRADERAFALQLSQAEAALAQSQKLEALGQLAGGIVHDFNNLLHIIHNSVLTAQRCAAPGDDGLRQCLEIARRGTDRASATANRLLTFARRQSLDPKPIDVNHLLVDMSDLLRMTVRSRVSTALLLSSGLWTVSVDTNQLETAVLNLATNARDAMPDGGSLTIETGNIFLGALYANSRGLRAGRYVAIAISDTGVGMTRELLGRAFDPFFTTKQPPPIRRGVNPRRLEIDCHPQPVRLLARRCTA